VLKSQQHLLNEAEDMLQAMPEAIRDRLPASKAVWLRLRALTTLSDEMSGEDWDAPTALRLRLLGEHARALSELEQREEEICCEMAKLVKQTGSTLDQLCGISTRSAAELLVEVGDPCRFTDGGFARFNGTAPLPASSAEGDDEPVRHRLNRGGNRRVNAVLHRMAVTQLRCEPRAQAIFNEARRHGHTKKEAMRVLKRQLSNVVHRRMLSDLQSRSDMAAAA
jgi:transposase